jgi:hypothetical protein
MDIQQEHRDRRRFLQRLYELTGGNEDKWIKIAMIGKDLGFDPEKTQRIFQYLHGEGLVETHTVGGGIGITHGGIREVEDHPSQPEQPGIEGSKT